MYDIPFDRSLLQLSNGIRHVMPSTDRKLELTAKASMAQPFSQPAVCCNVLTGIKWTLCVTILHSDYIVSRVTGYALVAEKFWYFR